MLYSAPHVIITLSGSANLGRDPRSEPEAPSSVHLDDWLGEKYIKSEEVFHKDFL